MNPGVDREPGIVGEPYVRNWELLMEVRRDRGSSTFEVLGERFTMLTSGS